MIVHKFGGTSLADAERIASVADILLAGRKTSQTVAVVSALAGTTDRLIAAARAAADGAAYDEALEWIVTTHRAVADALLSSSPEADDVDRLLEERLERVERLLDSIAVLGELTARGHDAVACFGEQLSAALVAAVLRSRGIEAEAIPATDLIVTDDAFGSASPLMPLTRERIKQRIRPLVDRGVLPVITGYIGATETGAPTTLGRSGSDFSAAIIAAALRSDELRIWTDVNGILTADPNVVPAARVLRELSYEEATRLARFGAEVLHPRTIGPVIEHAIPLSIVNSFSPEDPGTRIVEHPSTERLLWPAIVSAGDLRLIHLRGRNGSWRLRCATDALTQLGGAGIIVRMFSQSLSEQGINLVVPEQDAEHSIRLLHCDPGEARGRTADYVLDSTESVSTVSVIGLPSDRREGIASAAFAALGKHGVRVVAVAQAATEDSVTFCIPSDRAAQTVRFLHRELGLENGTGGPTDDANEG